MFYGISIEWSIEGGVYGINTRNGEIVSAEGLAELLPGLDPANPPGGDPNKGAGFLGQTAYSSGLRELLKNPTCLALLGGMSADTVLHDASVEDATDPNFHMSPGAQAAAFTEFINHQRYEYAVTLAYGTWILIGNSFKGLSSGQQYTVLLHELRHHALGGLGEPWSGSQYKSEYRAISKACGTQVPH
jgi:hypothetical protein